MKRLAWFFVALLVLAMALSCSGTSTPGTTAPNTEGSALGVNDNDSARQILLEGINASRIESGLDAVALDLTASEVALAHTDEMAEHGYLSHLDLKGLNPVERYNRAGGWEPAYENAWRRTGAGAPGNGTYGEIIAAWMTSAPHRENLLAPGHTHVGIGLSYDAKTDSLYAVALFLDRHAFAASVTEGANPHSFLLALDPEEFLFQEVLLARGESPKMRSDTWLEENKLYKLPDDYLAMYLEEGANNVHLPGAVSRPVLEYDKESGIIKGDIVIEPGWGSGMYYIYAWGKRIATGEKILLSLLTIEVG